MEKTSTNYIYKWSAERKATSNQPGATGEATMTVKHRLSVSDDESSERQELTGDREKPQLILTPNRRAQSSREYDGMTQTAAVSGLHPSI